MTRYVISPDTACAVVEDGAVLLHMRTRRYYSLNETGATIWQLLTDHVPIDEIAGRLAEQYDVEHTAAGEAVARLLGDLVDESLLSMESS